MISERVFQGIFDELNEYLMDGWENLVVYLEYGEASYSFSFYEKIHGEYVKCYDFPQVSDESLDTSFSKIDELISNERNKDVDSLWTNMTMTVKPTGEMHADFDYTDLSGGTYQFKKDWKKKYLV